MKKFLKKVAAIYLMALFFWSMPSFMIGMFQMSLEKPIPTWVDAGAMFFLAHLTLLVLVVPICLLGLSMFLVWTQMVVPLWNDERI